MAKRFNPLTARAELRQLDSLLRPWKVPARLNRPELGWIVAIREALGMAPGDFARRAAMHPSMVRRVEEGEERQSITLATLARAANALECDLVYALVPRSGSLHRTLEARARTVAMEETRSAADTMALEDQRPMRNEMDAQQRDVEAELLRASWSRLWRPLSGEAGGSKK